LLKFVKRTLSTNNTSFQSDGVHIFVHHL